ncbi:DUF1854 domain-containing protein [Candidatus Poribacteria bacterium]
MDKEADQIIDDSDFRLRFLEPEEVEFFRVADALRVTIVGDRSCLRVVPMYSFPLSMRDQYISLRDMEGDELGMIRNLDELDRDARKLLNAELRRRYFTPVIREIKSISDKFGIVEWEVETDRGPKKFLTRSLHDSLKEAGAGFIITDMENNRYEIRDSSHLDAHSASILTKRI